MVTLTHWLIPRRLGNDCPGNKVYTCTPYSGWAGTKISLDFLYGHGMIPDIIKERVDEVCADWYVSEPPGRRPRAPRTTWDWAGAARVTVVQHAPTRRAASRGPARLASRVACRSRRAARDAATALIRFPPPGIHSRARARARARAVAAFIR